MVKRLRPCWISPGLPDFANLPVWWHIRFLPAMRTKYECNIFVTSGIVAV